MVDQVSTGSGSSVSRDFLYGAKDQLYGTYNFIRIQPESNQSTSTITAGTGQDLVFTMPSRTCFNWQKSIISFTATPTAGGVGNFNWMYVNTIPFFQRVQITTSSGRTIMDCDNIHNKLAVELPIRTPLCKLQNNDIPAGAQAGLWQGLHCINTAVGGAAGQHADGVSMTKAYTEKKEITVGTTNAATPVLNWQFPLALFGSILSDPRILAFNEEISIRFSLSQLNKLGFISASATDPTSTPGALVTSVTLSGISMQLAVVQDRAIADEVLRSISPGGKGLDLLIDYQVSQKLGSTGTQQSISSTITRAYGPRLKSILMTIFQTEQNQNAYKRNNVAGAIYTQLQTYLNSVPLQVIPLQTSNTASPYGYDDYAHLQKLLANSSYQSSAEFYHDTFWVDYFFNHLEEDPRSVQGIEILSNIVYMAQLNTVSATNTIYLWMTFQRRLTINSNGTFLDGN